MGLYKIWLIIIFLVGIFTFRIFTTAAALISEAWPVPPHLPEYQVIRVIDGDTIEVEHLGKVRYTGVDTPEIYPPAKAEPYGKEAAFANQQLVAGQRVRLEFDIQKRDKYRRILAYVYIKSIFVNAYLVETGYAQVMTIPPNIKYADLFRKLQQEARLARRGLWGKTF
jgi:micrococcal nuclease